MLKNYKNYSWYDENRRAIWQNGVVEEMEETLIWERLEEAVLKEERYKRHYGSENKEATVLFYKLNYFTSSLCNDHEAIKISVAFPVASQFLKPSYCWKPVF